MMSHTNRITSLAIGLMLATSACGNGGGSGGNDRPDVERTASLIQFEDCGALEGYFEEIALKEMENISKGQYYYGLPDRGWPESPMPGSDDEADDDDSSGAPTDGDSMSDPNYTDTNTQEKGVDEADIVKTDGEYLYILSGNQLSIVEAMPPENMTLVGSAEIEGWTSEMMIRGDTALVFSSTGGWYGDPVPMGDDVASDAAIDSDILPPGEWTPPRLKATWLDVSDRAGPVVVRETYFDGDYQTSRRIGEKVHLVINSYLQGPPLEYSPVIDLPYPEWTDCEAPIRDLYSNYYDCDYYGDEDWDARETPGDAGSSDGGSDSPPSTEPGKPGECGLDPEIERQIQEFYNSDEYRNCQEDNQRRQDDYNEEYQNRYDDALAGMIERNKAKIAAATLDDWMPRSDDSVAGQGYITGCSQFYRPDLASGRGVISVVTLDISDIGSEINGSSVVSNPGIVYASLDALYLSSYYYDYWMWVGEWSEPPAEVSRLHKFDLTGTAAQYVASGEVPGQPLNQFSLDEEDGYLRIATTTQPVWQGDVVDDDDSVVGPMPDDGTVDSIDVDETTVEGKIASALIAPYDESRTNNHLFVLAQVGDTLETVGGITGIAPGERIYSARFMGDKGFLVTFVQIDPLFTLDLSDPAAPKIVGELKVPGFSTYLHDIGDGRLLTIGEAVDEDGRFREGLQLSIFDVRDFASPTLEHKLVIGEAYSEASYNHKAFNYFASLGVLAIPLTYYGAVEAEPDGPMHKDYFSGIMVFDVSAEDGITRRGEVDHADFVSDQPDYYYYQPTVSRSVMIDTCLFSISNLGVKANDLGDLEETLSKVELPQPEGYPGCGGPYGGVCYMD